MSKNILKALIIPMYSLLMIGFIPELLPLWHEIMYRLIFMGMEI